MKDNPHYGFGSTPNWSNFYKQQKLQAIYELFVRKGLCTSFFKDDKFDMVNYSPVMPLLDLTGSEKLHGTNMAVCFTNTGNLWVQGRKRNVTIENDQDGMALAVAANEFEWLGLITKLRQTYNVNLDTHTIVIDCEWAGGNIQKGNAACSGTDKAAYIFDYARSIDNETGKVTMLSTEGSEDTAHGIYNLRKFNTYEVFLNLNYPEVCEATLNEAALAVEANSPIAKHFNKPDNVGEGIYFWGYHNGDVLRLKAKGEKHGGKPKVPKTQVVSDADVAALTALAEKLTPVWRITQAIAETGATENKHIGALLKWVSQDIIKEELPTLTEANIEFKTVQKYVASEVKEYFKNYIKGY